MSIVVESASKSFGSLRALRDVDLNVERGSLTALLGPSGCGKTTLLRAIAGFETLDRGRVFANGRDVTALPVVKREIGFVFQHYALFPHLTVAANVAFALEIRNVPKERRKARVNELLSLVQLEDFGLRRPHELSGGQRQRIALARAMAAEPSILLLDEPFGALDLHVRRDLRRWLRELHDRTGTTTLLVTHDADEAMEIADSLVVLRDGAVQQHGTPSAVYAQPHNAFVMRFLGDVNTVHGSSSSIHVRPGDFRLETRPFGEAVPAHVQRVRDLGARTQIDLELPDRQQVTAEVASGRASALAAGPGATLYLEATRFHSFAEEQAS
jgi:sulfate transport system ATP-binding protein